MTNIEMKQKVYDSIEEVYGMCFCKKIKIKELIDMGEVTGYLTEFYINTGSVPTMTFAIEGTEDQYFEKLPDELRRLNLPKTSFYIANFKFQDNLYEEEKE